MSTPTCAACGTELIVSGPCVFCGHDPAVPLETPASVNLGGSAAPAPVFGDGPGTGLDDAAAGFEEELATDMAQFGGDDLIVGGGEVAETLVPGAGFEGLSTDLFDLLGSSEEEASDEEEEIVFLEDDDDDEGEIFVIDDDGDEGEEVIFDSADDEEPTGAGDGGLSAEEEAALLAALGDDDDDDDDDDESDLAALLDDDTDLAGLLDDDDDDVQEGPAFAAEGELGDDFLEASTGLVQQLIVPSAIHVDADTAAMLAPECVLGPVAGADASSLSVFEQTVFGFVNGRRTNARVAKRCGLTIGDLRIALALLVDRRAVKLVGHAQRSETQTPEPTPPEPAPNDDGWRMRFDDDTDIPADAPIEITPLPLDAADLGLELVESSGADPGVVPEGDAMSQVAADAYFEEGLLGLPGFDEPSVAPLNTPMPDASPMPTPARARVTVKDEAAPSSAHIKPRDVQLYEQARAVEQDGDHEKALKLLQEAARLNPQAAPVFNRMGVLLATKLGRVSAGMDAITKALQLEPKNETYQKNLNVVLERIDSGDEDQGPGKKSKEGLVSRLFKK